MCVGAIFSKFEYVTLESCVRDVDKESLRIRYDWDSGLQNRFTHEVSNIKMKNDFGLAIISGKRPFTESRQIRINGYDSERTYYIVDEEGTRSKVKYYSWGPCKELYRKKGIKILETHFCIQRKYSNFDNLQECDDSFKNGSLVLSYKGTLTPNYGHQSHKYKLTGILSDYPCYSDAPAIVVNIFKYPESLELNLLN